MRFSKIKSVKKIGSIPTIDLTINNKSHIFWANGIAASNSHSVAYGYNSYITAYLKTHFPVQFYCAYIDDAHNKMKPHEEIKELVLDAKNNGYYVSVPTLTDLNEHTYYIGNDIYLGLSSIKGMGEKAIIKLKNAVQQTQLPTTWIQYLIYLYPVVKGSLTQNLIKSGALDCFGLTRTRMLYELEIYERLTKSELDFINEDKITFGELSSLKDVVEKILSRKNRKPRVIVLTDLLKQVNEPPYSLSDTIDFIAQTETELLGLAITCHKSDSALNTITCKELAANSVQTGHFVLAGEISCVEYIVKRGKLAGQKMLILSVVDGSGRLDNISVFPGTLVKYKDLLYNGNIVSLQVKGWNGRISVEKVEQA